MLILSNSRNTSSNIYIRICYLAVPLFIFLIMLCAPYASDDFEFYSKDLQSSQQIFEYALYYGNGRLLGNMGAVFLVSHPVFCALVKSLVISSIIFLLPTVLGIRSVAGYMLSFLLLVCVEPELFGQVYSWTSGFQNYIPPILLTLLILYIIRFYPKIKSPTLRTAAYILVFVLGIAGQLYVEHVSIINLLLAAHHVWIFRAQKQKGCIGLCWTWMAAALIGLVMMFLIPIAFYVDGNRSTGYRSFNIDSLGAIIGSCIATALNFASYYSAFFILIVCAAAFMAIFTTHAQRTDRQNCWLYALLTISTIYLLMNDILCDNAWYGALSTPRKMITLVFVLLQSAVWLAACWKFEPSARSIIYSLLGYSFISLASLLIVSPTPLRVMYLPYVFISGSVLVCVSQFRAVLNDRQKSFARFAISTATAMIILLLSALFINVKWLADTRDKYIIQQMEQGASEIEVFAIPYDYVFWDGVWCFKKEYHHSTPGDIVFVELDFNTWMDKNYSGLSD